jgi:hypothetical protein
MARAESKIRMNQILRLKPPAKSRGGFVLFGASRRRQELRNIEM